MTTINIWALLISIVLAIIVNVVLAWDLYREKSKLKKLQNRVYKKAAQVLVEAQDYASSTIASYQKRLRRLTHDNTRILEEESKTLHDHYKEMVREVNDEFRKKAAGEVKEFGEEIDQEIASQLNKSKQEIEEYKKEKLANIDEAVVKVVKSASEEILGKAITLANHQTLITEALEKAKKEHFI